MHPSSSGRETAAAALVKHKSTYWLIRFTSMNDSHRLQIRISSIPLVAWLRLLREPKSEQMGF
jgi:hypothetical protein